jgi:hypothetical protein
MNSLIIDFSKTQKSNWRFLLGILLLLLSTSYALLVLFNENFNWMWILNAVVFLILGLNTMIEGTGFTIARLFGRAYLLINEEKCEYKPSNYKSATVINWNDVDTIHIGVSNIDYLKNDSVINQLEYSRFSYQQVQDIKSVLKSIAEKNGIKI